MSGDKQKMVPQGSPAPLGGGQTVPPSLLRANSGLLASQGPSQNGYHSLVSPRSQFNSMNMIGNSPTSFVHQSFGNGPQRSGQRGLIDGGAESDPLSGVGNGSGFNQPSSPYMSSPMASNPNSSGQVQQFSNNSSSQMLTDQQVDPQNFQHNSQQQFSVPGNSQQQPQQQQFQGTRGGLGGVGPLKMEPQVTNEHAQALRNLGPVKLKSQQLQITRGLGPVKMEPTDSSLYLHLQQQQQQHLLMSRQSSQAAAAAQLLHQHRLMQYQQQQLLKSMPQQRSPQFQNQNLPIRSPVKPVYEPGMCARRLTHYMYQQQHRPEDNSIEFWRKFVAEYFVPNAKKKWCVSMYGSGRQTTGVFPQDVWHCEICNRKPGRGFEATAEVLPRLFKIKYESGTLEELLYVDMPREYQNSSGQIVLDYAKAIQESVFDQLRVVRDGQLRIVFSPDLKICSWEFCARRHEELIPRRLLIPQVSQLGAAAQKCQAATSNASSSASVSELQNNCNMFVASARQLAKALEVPLVNDLGYTKRYVRCLQISEVVNSMKDLIDHSRETGTGPMESLAKYPQRRKPGLQDQPQQSEGRLQLQQQQQTVVQNSNNPAQAAVMQLASSNGMPSVTNGMPSASNTINSIPTTSSTGNIAMLLHQNSINPRNRNPISNANSPYGGNNSMQMPSPISASTTPQTQPVPSPFQSPAPSSSNNPQPNSANSPNVSMQQPSLSGDAEANDSQSSVQKIIHDMMMSSNLNVNGMLSANSSAEVASENPSMSGINSMIGPGVANGNPSMSGSGYGNMSTGHGQSTPLNGVRAAIGHNMSMNGRGMARESSLSQQQDLSNQLLNGLNGFNDLQFDWPSSP